MTEFARGLNNYAIVIQPKSQIPSQTHCFLAVKNNEPWTLKP